MKQLPILIFLGVVLSLCNLTTKLKNAGSSNSGSSGSSSSASDDKVETAKPTAAQTAALAGGQEIKWNEQGMSWTVPSKWTKVSDEEKSFLVRSPGGDEAANLNVNISSMDASFPVEISLKANYDGQQTRLKNGELDQLRWLEIDGVKGVQFRESNPRKPDGFRRTQWIAFRKYAGQVQMVNVMLSTNGKGFPEHENEIYGVLYSTKLQH
jgi:hypothetical protein